jgi:hypothetical protein
MSEELRTSLFTVAKNGVIKAVISNPTKESQYKKIEILKKAKGYQAIKYTSKQVFHENFNEMELLEFVEKLIDGFLQMNAWSSESEFELKISKKGKVFLKVKNTSLKSKQKNLDTDINYNIDIKDNKNISSGDFKSNTIDNMEHNRKKNYILEEGIIIPPLIDMGIFTKSGAVVRTMYDKFRQINRFIEIVDDTIKGKEFEVLRIVDFGCGKSYLTFILYYYLVYIRKIKTEIIGLDLKEEVILKCNNAAKRYGYSGLQFELGDINGYKTDKEIDMVITLHACDTATDYALFNAVNWKAKIILSVPCCQHELNGQIKSESYKILENYGILKERFAAMATDAIRGNLLTAMGYKTQILEFIDISHTPKNILIRAVKQPMLSVKKKQDALLEAEILMKEFNFEPTLYNLLFDK